MGRILLQLVGWLAVQGRRYCSNQAFIRSVCPSVHGWNAVERFCWTPNALHISCANVDVKCGSRSEMIHLGSPNQGTRCFKYSLATPGLSIVLVHGMNFATFKHPWSTIVSTESKPCDLGKSVMRSIKTYWKGPSLTGVSKHCNGAFDLCTLVFDS